MTDAEAPATVGVPFVAPNAQLGVQMFMLTMLDPHQVHVSLRRRAPAGQRGSGRRWWVRRTTVLLSAVVLAVCGAAVPAQAAPPHGIDVSYPQCGKPLPTGQAFAIVGVNHGSAATTNPCLATQLAWAEGSTGETVHDGVQLYVNTGNPAGGALWPRSGNTPYGDCDGSNSRPCAYQYGWERARDDATIRGISHPERYMWWLDVEIANAWDYTDGGGTRNAAVLEGMTDYFTSVSPRGVGLYSTKYQWGRIVGSGVDANSSLNGLSNWRPTGSTLERAQANCGLAPLTPGGVIEMTQYTTTLDYNHSCI